MIIAVDTGTPGTGEAEHLLHELLGRTGPLGREAVEFACTHWIVASTPPDADLLDPEPAGALPHVAVSLMLPGATTSRLLSWADERDAGMVMSWPGATEPVTHGPALLVRGAYLASVEAGLRAGGRIARFPGLGEVRGRLPAGDLRARCGIDLVEGIGGTPVGDDTPVETMNFLRPVWRNGRAVLLVQPAVGGVLVPFEAEHQQKCCSDR